ncbi:MAG: flavodoxin family protein [Candidatus Zixiibacteriota bacterium]|nr:MAG: flavodoxin family protein [candidate division Zixibacteria bacterium]
MKTTDITVLALIGSPRKQGNTDIMADRLLAAAEEQGAETSKIYLDDYDVRPIGEVCDNSRQRDDPRSDDDFPALLECFLGANVIVWSTPVYWQGPSAQMKCFLDRMSSYFNRAEYAERFRGKGHIVLCAFGRPEQKHGEWITEPMKLTAEVLHGAYLGDVCVSVYEKGKIREMPEALEACRKLGVECVGWVQERRKC